MPFSCPSKILSVSIYDCLFLSAESRTFYIHVTLFPPLLPYPHDVYRPRGALCRKSSTENKVDGDAIKESGSFDERTGNSDGGSNGISFALPRSRTHESLYTRIHTLPGRKKHDVGRRKIFRGLSVPFSILWRRVPADVILRETRRETTCRNYFWLVAMIPRSMREQHPTL